MDLELNLSKNDNDLWGFRLTGGAEFDVPFIVVNVTENSIAEKGGLKCNDIILSINDIEISGLLHNETHDLLIAAGNNLNLKIRRDLIENVSMASCDDAEVSNILQAQEQTEDFKLEKEKFHEIVDPTQNQNSQEVENTKIEETELNCEAKKLKVVREKKWSTFLQKPKNPKPVIKKQEDAPKGEPYRVVIKKQSKVKKEDIKNGYAEEDVVAEKEEAETGEEDEINKKLNGEFENQTEDEDKKISETEEEDRELEEQSTQSENTVIETDAQSEINREENEKNALLEKMLEEKLLEVQKQLEALSKLPSTIQSTIDAVTKQIANIVSAKEQLKEEDKESEEKALEGSDVEDDVIEQEIPEANASSDKEEEQLENQDEENEEPQEVESETEVKEEPEPEPVPELTEEEKEAERMQQELLEKQQKELEDFKQRRLKQKPTLPLKPIERPIILPGGRKWSNPDDAYSSGRPSKMSDEKIANTIETYSEVIIGKTKGLTIGTKYGRGPTGKKPFTGTTRINFMKYQPPPKNLDYLQKSDVYKLIHNMDTPVRGISSRPPKILSVDDYYQAG